MCGRVDKPSGKEVIVALKKQYKIDITLKEDFPEHKNLPPTLAIPMIAQNNPSVLNNAYWGLVPNYAKEFKMTYATFNATSENLFIGTTWKRLTGIKNCIVIVRGFYEWQYDDPKKKKGKHIFRINAKGANLTFMAGLYEDWVDKTTGEIKQSCAIITNPANELMAKIHNTKARMPAFLNSNNFMDWINPEIDIQQRIKLIEPVSNGFLDAVEVFEI
jgi:putative SOS response-associated peptidase YedK